MNIVKIISSEILSSGRRLVKFLKFGRSDVRTSNQSQSFGIDGNPIPGSIAIYADTGEKGKSVVLGYINESALSDIGELRIYSTDSDGVHKAFVWCKKDGILLINGDSDHAVRYMKLNDGLQPLVTSLQFELVNIAAAIGAVGGVYVPGTLSLDISESKIEEVKTP